MAYWSKNKKQNKLLIRLCYFPHPKFQDGTKPIQVAAARGNREAVEILFPLTSQIQNVPEWTIDGILEFMQSDSGTKQVIRLLNF